MRTRSFAVAAVSVLGLAIGACGTLLVTHEAQAPPAVVCYQLSSSCVEAKSNLDGMRPGYVFVDDQLAGLVLVGETRQFPMTGGQVHQVQFCAVYDVAAKRVWKCSTPIASLSNGNMPFVLEPLAVLQGGGNPASATLPDALK